MGVVVDILALLYSTAEEVKLVQQLRHCSRRPSTGYFKLPSMPLFTCSYQAHSRDDHCHDRCPAGR